MSDKRRLFDLIVEENIPALHHLLDGYINDKGNHMNHIHDFILVNNIVPDKLNIHKVECNNMYITLKYDNYKILQYDYINKILINESHKTYDLNIINLLFEQLKSLMIQTSANIHATSLYFFTRDEVLYLMTINSGLGIETHLRHDNLYTPYMLYTIGNIRTVDEQIKCVNIFFKILSLNIFYNILFSDNGNKPNKTIEEFNKIIDLCHFIDYDMNINVNFNDIDITFNKRTNKLKLDLKHDWKHDWKKPINCSSQINYYELLLKFLDETFTRTKLSEILEINKLNFEIEHIIDPSNSIKDDNQLLNKISLHKNHINEELYIYTQEGGSCSWFSVYWVFSIHNIIFNGYVKYCNHIKKINNVMINKCKEIFTKDNIYNEINQKNSTHSHALILLQKLISTNILDYSYINNFWDGIYERQMIFEFTDYKSSIKKLNLRIDNYHIEEILYFKIDTEKPAINNNHFLLMLYNLFQKNECKFNKRIIFNDIIQIINKIDIDKKDINKLINVADISKSIEEYNLVVENDVHKNNNLNCVVQFYFPANFIMQYYHLNIDKNKYSDDNLILFINFLNKIYIFLNIQEKIKITFDNTIKYYDDTKKENIMKIFYNNFFSDFYNIFINSERKISFYNLRGNNLLNLETFTKKICNFYKVPNFNFEVFHDKPNIKQFKIDELDIDRYIDLNNYLLNNPDILTNDLGNNQSINNLELCVNFYNANYFEIYKNEELKNKLLHYFNVVISS